MILDYYSVDSKALRWLRRKTLSQFRTRLFKEIFWYETRGYLYLWWWDKTYSLKRSAGPIARWVLSVLVILEFVVIPLHKWDFFTVRLSGLSGLSCPA